jgi:hypothetical protein
MSLILKNNNTLKRKCEVELRNYLYNNKKIKYNNDNDCSSFITLKTYFICGGNHNMNTCNICDNRLCHACLKANCSFIDCMGCIICKGDHHVYGCNKLNKNTTDGLYQVFAK